MCIMTLVGVTAAEVLKGQCGTMEFLNLSFFGKLDFISHSATQNLEMESNQVKKQNYEETL